MKITKKHVCVVLISFLLTTNFLMQALDTSESTHEAVRPERERVERQKESRFAWFKRTISERLGRIRDKIRGKSTSRRVEAKQEVIKTSVLFDPLKEGESRTHVAADLRSKEVIKESVVSDNEFGMRNRPVESQPSIKDPRQELMRADVASLVSDLELIRLEMREMSPVQLMKLDEVRHMLTILDLDPDDITQEIESMKAGEQQQAMIDHLFQSKGVVANSIESLALIRDFFSDKYYMPRIEEKLFEYLNEYRQYAELDRSKQPLSNAVLKHLIGRTMLRLQRIMDTRQPSELDHFSQKDWEYATGGISKKERQEMEQMG